ncbi:SH3 domain-containing protein [Aquibacillus rhizosphaerae]|uniref:SH3 domain-containing protein n=1 Tax=Aquibacillus rhizosphaerae TaxID=3051431 RepID=A0ABT7L0N9_9BACI|nr:SH3 domain-containing protein [Aquibacillus sp. LR5S19]MDL4838894.1 SH3 domain-containing protein [Aquibacillus sp. LR5S19]
MQKGSNNKVLLIPIIAVLFFIGLTFPRIASASYSNEFSDVDKGDTFYIPIMELTESGVINGYLDGTFQVNRTLVRRHGALLLYNALRPNVPANVEKTLSTYYNDVSVDSANAKEIAAVTPAIFKGSNRLFSPNDPMTREQVATTFVRAFGLKDNGTNPGINLSNVSLAHRNDVKILAQYGITKQSSNFNPKAAITRGEFAAFLFRTMNDKKSGSNILYTQYNSNFTDVINTQVTKTPKVDGAGRFISSKELVAYYANPNNFSKESSEFFQFLKLSYTDGLSASEINEKILKGKGSLEGTGASFIKAGKQYNINVIYLIGHALHETGNGTSALSTGYPVSEVNGKSVPEKKTYNMFGIKAFDDTALKDGSEHAYQQGWFTKEAAILGGAKFISSGYISEGQDTLYKMRWNPSVPGTHQYATHVSWATIQAKTIQKIYEQYNLLNAFDLIFDVPSYVNQPISSQKPIGDKQYGINTASAGWIGKTTVNLNLRVAPSTSYSVITTLAKGATVTVIGENGGWYKVKANDKIGWLSGDYLTFENLLQIDVDGSSSLNVRNSPNNGDVVGSLNRNDIVLGVIDSNGDFVKDGAWYKIIYQGKLAWIHGDFVIEK